MTHEYYRQIDPIERLSQQMAFQLDQGQGRSVAEAFQQELYDLEPWQFRQLLDSTMRNDRQYYGSDLMVEQNGDIVMSDASRGYYIGNLYEQSEYYQQRQMNWPSRPAQWSYVDDYDSPYYGGRQTDYGGYRGGSYGGNHVVSYGLMGAALGAVGGLIVDRRSGAGKGAAIGGLLGLAQGFGLFGTWA
jgi:hypothetical protein